MDSQAYCTKATEFRTIKTSINSIAKVEDPQNTRLILQGVEEHIIKRQARDVPLTYNNVSPVISC